MTAENTTTRTVQWRSSWDEDNNYVSAGWGNADPATIANVPIYTVEDGPRYLSLDEAADLAHYLLATVAAARGGVVPAAEVTLRQRLADMERELEVVTGQRVVVQQAFSAAKDRLYAALDLHKPMRIYGECGHTHQPGDPGTLEVDDVGLVCEDGYEYTICLECCALGVAQTEDCATNHPHLHDGPCYPCPTRRALEENSG